METTAREGASELAGYRLLIVEDDYFVAQDLRSTLERFGATIVGSAPTIPSARRLVRETRPDCVLLDINLDGDLAFELAHELSAIGTRTVFTTGYDTSFIPRSLRRHVCLQKPVDAGSLLRSIREEVRVSAG